MKNTRIWFKKQGTAKYISHLDLNRCMQRALLRAQIPVWHTEGFNQHPFVTFALPLSLGFGSDTETMDIKLTEDIEEADFVSRINACLPHGIEVYAVTEPVMKPGDVALGKFEIDVSPLFSDKENFAQGFEDFLNSSEILVDKKGKAGIKQIDLKPYLTDFELTKHANSVHISIFLPAGSTTNINPMLIVKAAEKHFDCELFADVTRVNIYNVEKEVFR